MNQSVSLSMSLTQIAHPLRYILGICISVLMLMDAAVKKSNLRVTVGVMRMPRARLSSYYQNEEYIK